MVGEERGRAVVWKLLNGIVIERVVEYSDLFSLPFWTFNLETGDDEWLKKFGL